MDSERITEHFWWEEILCPCCDRVRIMPAFWKHMEALEKLRQEVGFAILVNSGYRCKEHNTAVGGGTSSMHMLIATDIRPEEPNGRMTKQEKKSLAEGRLQEIYDIAPKFGFTGRGRYDTFNHLDIRAEKMDWRG
jgi:cytochrome oxidase assembly protein ShyY1